MTATVKDIEGKVRRASYEIVNIVKDLKTQRSPAVRELSHPQSPIQQLLLGQYGQKKNQKIHSECQDFFLPLVLATGLGASKVPLRADFGICNTDLRETRRRFST